MSNKDTTPKRMGRPPQSTVTQVYTGFFMPETTKHILIDLATQITVHEGKRVTLSDIIRKLIDDSLETVIKTKKVSGVTVDSLEKMWERIEAREEKLKREQAVLHDHKEFVEEGTA